jgi:hypothetical protein
VDASPCRRGSPRALYRREREHHGVGCQLIDDDSLGSRPVIDGRSRELRCHRGDVGSIRPDGIRAEAAAGGTHGEPVLEGGGEGRRAEGHAARDGRSLTWIMTVIEGSCGSTTHAKATCRRVQQFTDRSTVGGLARLGPRCARYD